MKSGNQSHPAAGPNGTLMEVRYSLGELMHEVTLERSAAAFAMEKLDQTEIAKLFQKNRARRNRKTK